MARPFRLAEPVPPEDDLHAAVAHALNVLVLPPAMWTTFPAGNVPLPAQFAVKLLRIGLKRGWPDILILHAGRIYGVELKRIGAQLSATRNVRSRRGAIRRVEGQRDVFPRLEAAGMSIAVCYTVAEVLDALDRWGVPLRGRIAA